MTECRKLETPNGKKSGETYNQAPNHGVMVPLYYASSPRKRLRGGIQALPAALHKKEGVCGLDRFCITRLSDDLVKTIGCDVESSMTRPPIRKAPLNGFYKTPAAIVF
jgi:hypothetical protein